VIPYLPKVGKKSGDTIPT